MSDFLWILYDDEYSEQHNTAQITELNLYKENIAFLSEQDITLMMQEDKGDFAYYVDQFLAHDKYVIAAPLWNLFFPAIFKAYLDRIITVGKTFAYGEKGIYPLSQGKKALLFMARGDTPVEYHDFANNYWNTINQTFLGLDSQIIFFDGTAVLSNESRQGQFNKKLKEIDTAINWFK